MPRSFRIARNLLLLCFFALVAVAVLGALFGGEVLRVTLERALQARMQPVVHIEGPVRWRVTRGAGVSVQDVYLEDARGETVLHVREASAELALGALVKGRLVLSALDVAGLDVHLHQGDDGRWNATDWLIAERDGGTAAPAPGVAIDRMTVRDARIRVDGGVQATFSGVVLEAGPIVPDAPGALSLRGQVEMHALENRTYGFVMHADFESAGNGAQLKDGHLSAEDWPAKDEGNKAKLTFARAALRPDGRVHAEGLDGAIAATLAEREIDARFALAALSGKAAQWRGEGLTGAVEVAGVGNEHFEATLSAATFVLDDQAWRLPQFALQLTDAGRAFRAHASGHASGRVDTQAVVVDLREGEAVMPHPGDASTSLSLAFSAVARFDAATLAADGEIQGRFGESRFAGEWAVDPEGRPPLALTLKLDRLDLDAYLGPNEDPEAGLDLAAWRNWPLRADLRVGVLTVQGFSSADARLQLVGGTGAQSAGLEQ